MIFDPALAAAARRHARKHNRANHASAPPNAENSGSSSSGAAAAPPAAPGGNVLQEPSVSGGGGGAAARSDSGEHAGAKVVVGSAERIASGSSNAGEGGLLSRTASASTNGGDGDGSTRVAPVAPRPRAMKPRMLLKIVVLGCSNVGKTSLMKRYAANDFTDKRRPTIGADFMTKEIVSGDQPMLLQVWDTAGQERFHGGSLGSGFFRGANAALLVYDVACAVSFEQVAMWREELLVRLDVDPHDFPIVVIGNKVDLAKGLPMDGLHGVDKSRVLKWCEMQGMGHIETSAKDGTGVEVAMQAVAMLALDQKRKRERDLVINPFLGGGTTLDLADERARQQRQKGCCW